MEPTGTAYNPDFTSLMNDVNTTSGQATSYQSAADMLPAKLKQAILEKVNYNQDIIQQQNEAQAKYFEAPSAARQQYSNIFDPFAREALVAHATSQAYSPYATLTDILGQRMGNINDLVSAGTGAFNSAVTAQQGKATLAQKNLENASSLYKLTHPSDGGGGDLSSLTDLIKLLNLKGTGQTEQKPVNLPVAPFQGIDPNQTYLSPEGQWAWDQDSAEWVPVTD